MKKALFPIENRAFSLRVLCIRAGAFPEGRGGRFVAFRRRLAFSVFRVRVFPRIGGPVCCFREAWRLLQSLLILRLRSLFRSPVVSSALPLSRSPDLPVLSRGLS